MQQRFSRQYLAVVLAVAGCRSSVAEGPLTASEIAAIADSVRAAIQTFNAAPDSGDCRAVGVPLSVYRYPQAGFLFLEDTVMATVTEAEGRALMEQSQCAARTREFRLDSLQVRVLGRRLAVAGWRFTEEVVDTSGQRQRVTGLVFGPWVRDSVGWGIGAAMSSHIPLSPTR